MMHQGMNLVQMSLQNNRWEAEKIGSMQTNILLGSKQNQNKLYNQEKIIGGSWGTAAA